MSLSISLMTIEDIPHCADIYISAFAQDAFSLAAFPRDATPGLRQWWIDMDTDDFQNQPAARYIKASIDGTIIGFAKWNIPTRHDDGTWTNGGDDPDALPIFPEGANQDIATKFLGTLAHKRREIMANRPHCYLEMVATLPEFRGRGAASHLIRWGLSIADEMGLEAYLEGNEDNLALYRRFGFEVVDEYRLIELDYLESFMVRSARKKCL